ncbi:MAG TPA: hypothetical protein VJX67_21405 [Blastocatellia bacterium]|nr:hypothetical protein [Blastocatellia bacterium]
MSAKIDLAGKTFGFLTVLKLADSQSRTASQLWDCRCRCGLLRKARTSPLRAGAVWACYQCTRAHEIPADVLHLRNSKQASLLAESEYIQDWRRYLESFSDRELTEFKNIMHGRKRTEVNLAEAVDVVKREKL